MSSSFLLFLQDEIPNKPPWGRKLLFCYFSFILISVNLPSKLYFVCCFLCPFSTVVSDEKNASTWIIKVYLEPTTGLFFPGFSLLCLTTSITHYFKPTYSRFHSLMISSFWVHSSAVGIKLVQGLFGGKKKRLWQWKWQRSQRDPRETCQHSC